MAPNVRGTLGCPQRCKGVPNEAVVPEIHFDANIDAISNFVLYEEDKIQAHVDNILGPELPDPDYSKLYSSKTNPFLLDPEDRELENAGTEHMAHPTSDLVEADPPHSGVLAGYATHYEDITIESSSAHNDQGPRACGNSKAPGLSLVRRHPPTTTVDQAKEQFSVLMSQTHRSAKVGLLRTAKRKYGDESSVYSDGRAGAHKRERRQKYPSLRYNDAASCP